MVPIDCTWDKRNILLRFMILSACWTSIQPMLDKDCMILEKLNGVKDDTGVIRTKKYAELSAAEKIQADCGESYQYHSLRKESLINDMNIYKMKIEQFQVNTKFLNSLPPEWSKFVTDVKLVKDLHTSNFDQLHAYLEQYELHANEVRIMREGYQDPLAFVANQQMTPPRFNTYQSYQSSYNNPQLQQ
ncbi:hypothetical protein Tco_0597740 [Tanacetum coccineum]